MATIAEKLQTIADIKESIKEAINAKGGTIENTTPFAEYPTQIEAIKGGGGGTMNRKEFTRKMLVFK